MHIYQLAFHNFLHLILLLKAYQSSHVTSYVYKQLLQVNASTTNTGVKASITNIQSGDGTASALNIGTGGVIVSGKWSFSSGISVGDAAWTGGKAAGGALLLNQTVGRIPGLKKYKLPVLAIGGITGAIDLSGQLVDATLGSPSPVMDFWRTENNQKQTLLSYFQGPEGLQFIRQMTGIDYQLTDMERLRDIVDVIWNYKTEGGTSVDNIANDFDGLIKEDGQIYNTDPNVIRDVNTIAAEMILSDFDIRGIAEGGEAYKELVGDAGNGAKVRYLAYINADLHNNIPLRMSSQIIGKEDGKNIVNNKILTAKRSSEDQGLYYMTVIDAIAYKSNDPQAVITELARRMIYDYQDLTYFLLF